MLINGFSRGTPSHSSQSRSESVSASSRYACSLMRLTMAMMSASRWQSAVPRGMVLKPLSAIGLCSSMPSCRLAVLPSCRLAVLSSPPDKHSLEGIEEGSRVLELGQETLLVPLQEVRPEISRETALVVRKQASPYPLNHRLA